MTWYTRQRSRRLVILASAAAVSAVCYGALLAWFHVSDEPEEQHFGAAPDQAGIALYLQPVLIDPINDSMQMRVSVLPATSPGARPPRVADRDLSLLIRRGSQTSQLLIRANQPFPEEIFSFDLETGTIRSYPLDEYRSDMHIVVLEGGQTVPSHVASWEGIFGYQVHGQELAADNPGELRLRFTIRRTGAIAFFGIAVYGAMVVLALCALTIGTLVFLGIRKIEVTFVGALGAITFALPALRNALPGTPPLGIWPDVLIFFWAELVAVLALCLFLVAWARRGAAP